VSDTPDSSSAARTSFRELLDSISKAAVVGILTLYVFGFLIVSIHNAEYGFSDVNPIKPRIMAAGTLFALFCIYPIAVARTFFLHSLQLNPVQRFSRGILASLNFLSACIVSSVVLSKLYDDRSTVVANPTSGWATLVSIVAVLAVLVAWGWLMSVGWTYYEKHPFRIAIGALAMVMLFVSYLFVHSDKTILFAVALWFFAVGVASEIVRHNLTHSRQQQRFTAFDLLVPSVVLLTFFALKVYPRVKPSWGGGSSTSVVVYFSEASRILPSQNLECDLLDESDNGIYIVKRGQTKALFIPRAALSAIYFADKPLGSEFLNQGPSQPSKPTQPQRHP